MECTWYNLALVAKGLMQWKWKALGRIWHLVAKGLMQLKCNTLKAIQLKWNALTEKGNVLKQYLLVGPSLPRP